MHLRASAVALLFVLPMLAVDGTVVNKTTGKDMTWFFNVYLRQPKLPVLSYQKAGNTLNLQWKTPDNLPFPMPVEIEIGGEMKRVEMPGGKGSIALPADGKFTVDPHHWVLKEL